VLDRVEVKLDPEVPFTNYFQSVCGDLRWESSPTELYKEKVYLEGEFGATVILLRWCRFGASHKIVFLETAKTTLRQMAETIENIFDCTSGDLRLARVDAAVDVPGIPMEWVRSHVSVPHKHYLKEFGTSRDAKTQNRTGTLYFGRGGDFVRIYDKRAEQMKKYMSLKRKVEPESLPSFEEFSGIASTDLQVTRFERQMRVGRIPPSIATFGDLEQNIANFDFFSPIVIHPGRKPEPNNEEYSLRRYLEGKGLRQTIIELGLAKTLALLNAKSGGNAGRKVQLLSDFLLPDPAGFTRPNLFAIFQESVGRQLVGYAARPDGTDGAQRDAAGDSRSEI
jgi:hypothetical protein